MVRNADQSIHNKICFKGQFLYALHWQQNFLTFHGRFCFIHICFLLDENDV